MRTCSSCASSSVSSRALCPRSSLQRAPTQEARWIPATPAFTGAGKCRDDSVVHASRPVPYNLLLDRAEDRAATFIQHLQAHHVAELEERRPRLAFQDGLHRTQLGEAGIAGPALLHRPGGPVLAPVGHG